MKILVLIHVLSAVIGVGPTYFGLSLLNAGNTPKDLQGILKMGKRLEMFPKIGGTLAVLSGLALILLANYGPFTQLWLLGSLVLYILIQAIVIGFVAPKANRLANWVFDPQNAIASTLPDEQQGLLKNIRLGHVLAAALGTVLFALMVLKPQ